MKLLTDLTSLPLLVKNTNTGETGGNLKMPYFAYQLRFSGQGIEKGGTPSLLFFLYSLKFSSIFWPIYILRVRPYKTSTNVEDGIFSLPVYSDDFLIE